MERRERRGLFRIAGIPVRIHFTWLFIAAYLAVLFAGEFSRLAQAAKIGDTQALLSPWAWGILLTLALFSCVLLHELAHVIVARRGGAQVRSITLMMLGGVSEIGEVDRPRLERRMAVAGPLLSLGLGAAFYGLFRLAASGPPDLRFGLFYLAQVNFVIGVFNLLPAFPMDGGRVLRSVLEERHGRVRATRIAATIGKVVAAGLVMIGILGGNWWLALIGLFIFVGGQAEVRATAAKAMLAGARVAELYVPRVATVPAQGTAQDAAQALIENRATVGIVVSDGKPIGQVSAATLAAIPVRERATVPVARLMQPVALVSPHEEVTDVVRRLDDEGVEAAAVVDGGVLVGTLTREHIARGLELRELARS